MSRLTHALNHKKPLANKGVSRYSHSQTAEAEESLAVGITGSELADVTAPPTARYTSTTESTNGDSVHPDTLNLHIIWRETNTRLDLLAREVREGKNVMEASNFCRWLNFSGILKLLEQFQSPGPLEVNGAALRKKTNDILYDCGELFRNGKADPKYAASDIAEINRKLDLIAGHVAKLSSTPVIEEPKTETPDLRVIQGGAQP